MALQQELGSFKQSGVCWKRAMETLDMSKATSAKLKETYEASLKRAEERLENIKGLAHRLDSEYERNKKFPWDRAAYLVPIMKENEVYQSSVSSYSMITCEKISYFPLGICGPLCT